MTSPTDMPLEDMIDKIHKFYQQVLCKPVYFVMFPGWTIRVWVSEDGDKPNTYIQEASASRIEDAWERLYRKIFPQTG